MAKPPFRLRSTGATAESAVARFHFRYTSRSCDIIPIEYAVCVIRLAHDRPKVAQEAAQLLGHGFMERMFAVAIRDRNDLFLWIRLRRAAGNDIYYVLPTGREHDPKWAKGNPHGSWHKDGRVHHKSFNRKFFATARQKPNASFKGTYNLLTRGIASDEPRAFGVPCDPTKFSAIMEIPVTILSPKHYEMNTSIDVSEPGLQPLMLSGIEDILYQHIFDDDIPHITVTVYSFRRLLSPAGRA